MTTARTLDIIITYISPSRVYYGFPVGEARIEHADIYPEGKFDLSTIEVGKRYVVSTKVMPCLVWNHKAQQSTYKDKYVWITAREVKLQAKLASQTSKQRKVNEALAAKPLVDDGSLFTW
jgi:hypothetical protein